ncbi:iron uptake cluster protein [Epithele typhae]|uniref:iron uptake cluster protein n=1 Tax=Epithele typhae TaxID=378194 RepID=UPI002008DF55|nr:iron uptake cluster protein [Epithele typhae]KAH9945201.1 iron uptake cluster protein [Epithele typhae]
MKTVAILGGSYGGARAATLLAQGLPHGWRVVLVDRNSHINHLYVLPRYAVLPGHEHKAFIPYNNVFLPPRTGSTPGPLVHPAYTDPARSVLLHASVTSLATHTLTLDRAFPEHGVSEADRTLHFDYLIYALGSHLPSPINLWDPAAGDVERAEVLDVARGTKGGGVAFLKQFQRRVSRAASVLVVGGGALGIQFASDIAEIYPATNVTLLHSRHRLLPRFDEAMHSEIVSSLSALNVCTILGDRLDLASLADNKHSNGERVVRTQSGREVQAELVLLCTGQTPNTWLLRDAFPQSVVADGPDKGLARVRRTLQLAEPVPESGLPTAVVEDARTRIAASHIFAIGDAADAFGAVNAGHNAFFQGEVAARNVIRLIKQAERKQKAEPEDLELEKYTPGAPAIKVSLGLTKSVYQYQGVIGTRDEEQDDLDIHIMWRYFGYEVERGDLDTDRPDEEIPGAVPRLVYTTKEVTV